MQTKVKVNKKMRAQTSLLIDSNHQGRRREQQATATKIKLQDEMGEFISYLFFCFNKYRFPQSFTVRVQVLDIQKLV